jgi:hypothetical protein
MEFIGFVGLIGLLGLLELKSHQVLRWCCAAVLLFFEFIRFSIAFNPGTTK